MNAVNQVYVMWSNSDEWFLQDYYHVNAQLAIDYASNKLLNPNVKKVKVVNSVSGEVVFSANGSKNW